jgi:hypothetical protein
MKRLLFISCFLLSGFLSKAQKDTLACKGLSNVSISMSIQNLPFTSDSISISADSIRKGFKLSLLDKTFKIIGYRAYYETDDSDVYYRDIYGDTADQNNFPILKNAKKGALIFIECINLTKDKKRYGAKHLIIYLM